MKKRVAQSNHVVKRNVMRHAVPVLVWLMTVGVVIWLFLQRAQRFQVVGIARGEVRQIAASSTARIQSISVDLFQPVQAGQTVAVVDTVLDNEQMLEADLRMQLAATGAEAERLAALLIPTQEQLQAAVADLKINREDNYRRFIVDVESVRLRILELQVQIATDRVALDELAMEVKINERLLEEDAIVPYELEKSKVQHQSIARKIEESERLLEQTKADLQEAERRRDRFAQEEVPEQSVGEALEAVRREIKVQEQLMKGLLDQLAALKSRRALELKAPIDGVVIPIRVNDNEALHQRPGEQVLRRVGEVVAAGEPILAVSQAQPTEIVAYVTEQQLGLVQEQMEVQLVKTRPPAQIARASVVSIGPTIELMPQRLWFNPTVPQWGCPVLINIPAGLSLVPGELVGIRGL
jgi:multidrug resistance efflux pump